MSKQTFTTGQVLTAAQMTSLQQTAMGGGSTTAKTASYVLVAADAGTVVQMNAAGATTITVNTALFSAGDSLQIQNIGAGVCTVTAGTATVSTAGSLALSQYEGGQLYFNTTSAALFFDIVQGSGMTNPMTTTGDIIYSSSGSTPARLGIGTAGQVLSVTSGLPAWAASSGFGSWTNYTPTISAEVGTATSITNIAGRYQLNGPTVLVQATWRVTTVGTALGYTQITLPYTSKSTALIAVGVCTETESAGTMGFAKNVPGQNYARSNTYSGGSWWTVNFTMNIQIEYEVA